MSEQNKATVNDEVAYLKGVIRTQERVIQQLAFGAKPGQPVLIHPFDLFEMLEGRTDARIVNQGVLIPGTELPCEAIVVIGDTYYERTPCIPASTEQFQ